MSNDKHTPTPWTNNECNITYYTKRGNFFVAECEREEDAARIVQCVNEYDGLIKTIATLRADKAELIEALKQIEQFSDIGDDLLAVVRMKRIASQTLAKYQTK
jgi:hypothetical protein